MATAGVEEADDTSRMALRNSARHEPVLRDARVAWWGEPDESEESEPFDPDATAEFDGLAFEPRPHHLFALLLDISASGARVVVDRLPCDERPIWFRLDARSGGDWAEAHIIGATTTPRGPHVLRLAFRAPCPFDTLREAVCG